MNHGLPRFVAALAVVGALCDLATPFSEVGEFAGRADPPPSREDFEDEPQEPTTAKVVESFLRGKLTEARELFERGHYLGAFRIADGILVLAPDVAFRAEVQRLRRRSEARYLGKHVLTIHFELNPHRNPFPVEVLHGFLVLENVSPDPVRIGELDESAILGRAIYEVIELFADGTEVATQASRVIRLESGVALEPGEFHRVPVEFDVPRSSGEPVLQALLMTGTLRPPLLEVAARKISRGIPWQGVWAVLLPPELEAAALHPYRELQRALLERDPRRLVVSTRLWRQRLNEAEELAKPLRERTVDLLLTSLTADGDGIDALIIRELATLTGERRAGTVESWRIWALERHQKRRRLEENRKITAPRSH